VTDLSPGRGPEGEKKRRAPGAGRPPTDPTTHKQRRTVTLSPRAWAIVAAYRAQHRHRSVSAALEALLRQEETP
jgi:hypothetical protein